MKNKVGVPYILYDSGTSPSTYRLGKPLPLKRVTEQQLSECETKIPQKVVPIFREKKTWRQKLREFVKSVIN